MTDRRPVTLLVALAISTATLACDRVRFGSASDTAIALSEAPAPTPDSAPPASDSAAPAPTAPPAVSLQALPADTAADDDAPIGERLHARRTTFPLDTAFLLESVEEFVSRNLYLHWAPHPTDDGDDPICTDRGDESYSLNAAWGLARARVRRLSFADSTGAKASADISVLRVMTIEGDPESDSSYGAEDMMTVAPVKDVIVLSLRRRSDGRWVPCALFARRAAGDPISLIGSSVDREAPRGRRISRFVPEGASWLRAGALADSIERSGMD